MKDVMVRIKGMQSSRESGNEEIEFITEAQLYDRNGALYLVYDESEVSGAPGCKTRLRLRGKEVQMKRFGEGGGIGSELRFEEGKRFNGLYDTPFGAIEIEVLTNSLINSLSEEGKGQIEIDYDISLKGLLEGRNILNITLMNSEVQ